MDVAGPEARCEQAEGGHQATAVHAEQLVLVGDVLHKGSARRKRGGNIWTRQRLP
jgi:hypothetical protein